MVEMAVVLTIMGVLLAIAIPQVNTMMANSRVRSVVESISNGLRKARGLAIARNYTTGVRFTFVDSLTNSCQPNGVGPNWVVTLANPTNSCATAQQSNPSPSAGVGMFEKSNGASFPAWLTISTSATGGVLFDSFGRLYDGTDGITRLNGTTNINVFRGGSNACQSGETGCNFNVAISGAGTIKVCDTQVSPGGYGACN